MNLALLVAAALATPGHHHHPPVHHHHRPVRHHRLARSEVKASGPTTVLPSVGGSVGAATLGVGFSVGALAIPNGLYVAEQAAVAYWHGTPCGGAIAITFDGSPLTPDVSAPPGAMTIAQAHWITGCSITFYTQFWTTLSGPVAISWPLVCQTVVHEWGHLMGFREYPGYRGDPIHSADPANVMYPTFTGRNEPALCGRAPR